MYSQKITDLESRMKKLERTNRLLLTFAAAGIAAALIGWQAVPNSIKARSFEVIDDKGKQRAALWTGDGAVGLALNDADGKPMASFDCFGKDPGIVMFDRQGNRRLRLVMYENEPILYYVDGRGQRVDVFGR
ncbi:MAG: hypothetical protein ABIV13_01960 [Fimbriimonadales bacterium]